MSITRAIFQKVTLLIGLVAILLGALEHEDLILQRDANVELVSQDHGDASPSRRTLQAETADSGTESTFRQELDHGCPFQLPRLHAALPGDVYTRLYRTPARQSVVDAPGWGAGAQDIPLRL